jgi:hypothetical protein
LAELIILGRQFLQTHIQTHIALPAVPSGRPLEAFRHIHANRAIEAIATIHPATPATCRKPGCNLGV